MKKVHNKNRKFGSAKYYYADWIGGTPLLFTEHDIEEAKRRAESNPEDVPVGKFSITQYDRVTIVLLVVFSGMVGVCCACLLNLLK